MLGEPSEPNLSLTAIKSIASDPGFTELVGEHPAKGVRQGQPGVPPPVVSNRPDRGRAGGRVQAAISAELAGRPSDPGPTTPAGATTLWVAEPPTAVPDLPGRVEQLDLAAIDGDRRRGTEGGEVAVAACVLDGVLDHLDDPGSLLAWAYRRLQPGGRLVLSVRDVRAARPRRLRSLTAADPRLVHLFPGETLQSLLFREGFGEPRLRRCGAELIVSARRSPLPPPAQRSQRLSVIVPAYNEVATFGTTMDLLIEKTIPGLEIEVIVVESNSSDGTREKALSYSEHPRVRVILEEKARGKGHAVRTGLKAARGDFLLIQDADMEYDIDDYEVLLEPLRSGAVGFVLGMRTGLNGSRGMRQFGQRGVTSRVMNLGHEVFLGLFNVVYGQRLRDPFTMYKVVRRDCLYGLSFECNRFDFDWELAAKLIRAGYHPREIPVTYRSRSFSDGKKVGFVRDPLTWVRACLKYRFAALYPKD